QESISEPETSEPVSKDYGIISPVVGTFQGYKEDYGIVDETKESEKLGRFIRPLTRFRKLQRRKKQAPLDPEKVSRPNVVLQVATVINNICLNNTCINGTCCTSTESTRKTQSTSQTKSTRKTQSTSQTTSTRKIQSTSQTTRTRKTQSTSQ
ncbi:unnamed protein product, partial [Larinioides sclopetarius]